MARVYCDNCGEGLTRSPRLLKQNKHNFCNKKCNTEWLHKNIDIVSKRNQKISSKYWRRRNENNNKKENGRTEKNKK